MRALALGVALAAWAGVAVAAPLDAPLGEAARASVRATLESLGEADAATLADGATGVVAEGPAMGTGETQGYGDAQAPDATLAVVRLHDKRFCTGDRCLTMVGTMGPTRMAVCAAFAAGGDLKPLGAVRDVLGATAQALAFGDGAARVVVMVRPGLCLVVPPAPPRPMPAGGAAPVPGEAPADEAGAAPEDGTSQ